jgi:hypothetical protein
MSSCPVARSTPITLSRASSYSHAGAVGAGPAGSGRDVWTGGSVRATRVGPSGIPPRLSHRAAATPATNVAGTATIQTRLGRIHPMRIRRQRSAALAYFTDS